ncbi:hypothetical+protein [Methylocapsa aurea]|uniref:hypothetical protein n=1 Tax=Methylocapsa aurea TaxID=663610 RepID=UPI003D18A2A9
MPTQSSIPSPQPSPNASPLTGKIEKIAQGLVYGWLSGVDDGMLLSVNGITIARIDGKNLDAPSSKGAPRRQFSYDARGIAPNLLLADTLTFELRLAAKDITALDRIDIPAANFLLPPVRPARMSAAAEGYIDEYLRGQLRGWVRDRSLPESPVAIHVFLGKRFIGRHMANRYRPDLAAAGKGDGHAGFEIDLTTFFEKFDPQKKRLRVFAGQLGDWSIPFAEHARQSPFKSVSAFFRRMSPLGPFPRNTEEFVTQLMQTPPYPKKVFDIASIAEKKMPEPFSADYTLLAIEFLRREAAVLAEVRPDNADDWRKHNKQFKLLELQMKRLCALGESVAASQKLMHSAAQSATALPSTKPAEEIDEDRRRKA